MYREKDDFLTATIESFIRKTINLIFTVLFCLFFIYLFIYLFIFGAAYTLEIRFHIYISGHLRSFHLHAMLLNTKILNRSI